LESKASSSNIQAPEKLQAQNFKVGFARLMKIPPPIAGQARGL
jgi:hypothetical protein